MLISSKFFDFNHINELSRYSKTSKNSLHILSEKNKSRNSFKKITTQLLLVNDTDILRGLEKIESSYDLIIITDLFELTDDIYGFLKKIKKHLTKDGKLLMTSVNTKWNSTLKLFEKLNFKTKTNSRSYITPKKISSIANSCGYELITHYSRQIFPFRLFGVGKFTNQFLEILLKFFNLGIKNYMVFNFYEESKVSLSKTIIIPAKNEEENLVPLIKRIPKFRENYELIIIYGSSEDKTEEIANNLPNVFTDINIKVLKQTGKGKANAVWDGVSRATNELIAILDSDQSVDPETLVDFFEIIENGNADFVNGTRLIYPMEQKAMRRLNTIGNKVFQFLIASVVGQDLSDSLCGTKVFKKSNLNKLYYWQNLLSSNDPFGDFDLIFSSAYAGDKILEYPVHYRARVYGDTQISRFKDGFKLIKYFLESFYLFNISK